MKSLPFAALLLLAPLVGCGGSITLSISEAELQTKLESAFPITSDDESMPITATLSDPEVILEDGSDRMGLKVKIVAKPRDGAGPSAPPVAKPPLPSPPGPPGKALPSPPKSNASSSGQPPKDFSGTATFSGKVAYREGAFYILDLTVDEVAIDALPGTMDEPLRKVASKLLSSFLEKTPVYTLADDTGSATAKMLLKSVSIKNGQMNIEVGP